LVGQAGTWPLRKWGKRPHTKFFRLPLDKVGLYQVQVVVLHLFPPFGELFGNAQRPRTFKTKLSKRNSTPLAHILEGEGVHI